MGKKKYSRFFPIPYLYLPPAVYSPTVKFVYYSYSNKLRGTKKKRIEGVSIASTAENSLLVECLDMAKESSLFYVRKVGIIWPEISTVTKLAIVENISWITMGNRGKDVLASLLSFVYL